MAELSMLDAACGLASTISARAAETEALRSVPADLAADLADIGIYRMYVPRSLGGREIEPAEAVQVVEVLSHADGSTGWTGLILNTTCFAAWLEPRVAAEVLGPDSNSGMAGLFGPMGQATYEGDRDLRLSGRWAFNSGSHHASWFCEGAFVLDTDGKPRALPTGRPDWRVLFLPATEVEIQDNWRVSGLRGTASNDVVIDDVLIPEERTASPMFETAPQNAPHFRWTFFALLSSLMAGFPLGVARRAVDEFAIIAGSKSRGGGPALGDTETVAVAVSRCDAAVRAARAFVLEAVGEGWQQALAGDPLTLAQRIAIKSSAMHAMRSAVDVVDTLFSLAGGSALFDDNVLQRCWRDVHAANHHIFYSNSHAERAGKALLGRPTDLGLL